MRMRNRKHARHVGAEKCNGSSACWSIRPQHYKSGTMLSLKQVAGVFVTLGTGMHKRYLHPESTRIGGSPLVRPQLFDPDGDHRLSKVLRTYIRAKHLFHSQKYVDSKRMAVANAIRVIGDVSITRIGRQDVDKLIEDAQKRGSSPTNIQHRLYLLHGLVKFYLDELASKFPNPFRRPKVPGAKFGQIRSSPPTRDCVGAIADLCVDKDDDIRWMLALLLNTGARAAEIAGLALSDIHVDDPEPFLIIQPHPWRQLKTRFSQRVIPLVGISLWAARRLVSCARENQTHAFPRYIKQGRLTETPHKTLQVWLRTRGINFGLHALRRAFAQRISELPCDSQSRAEILGIKTHWMYSPYGFGQRISTTRDLLEVSELGPVSAQQLRCAGYDRVLSPYQCGLEVMRAISTLSRPTIGNIRRSSRLDRIDVDRGIRHARAHGVLVFNGSSREGCYFLTGEALPVTRQGLRPKRRKMPRLLANEYLRERRKLRPPIHGLEAAMCFPQNDRIEAEAPCTAELHNKRNRIRACLGPRATSMAIVR